MKKKANALFLIAAALFMLFAAGTVSAEAYELTNGVWKTGTAYSTERNFIYTYTLPSDGRISVELEVTDSSTHTVDGQSHTPQVALYYKITDPNSGGFWNYEIVTYENSYKPASGVWHNKNTVYQISVEGNGKYTIPYRIRVVFTPDTVITPTPTPTPAPSQASPPASGWYFIRSANGSKVLDIHNLSLENGGNLEIYGKNGGTNQIFYLKKGSDGYYTIRALHSNKYLHKENSGKGQNVHQWSGSTANNTKWRIRSDGNGWFTIENKTGGYLDNANGSTADGNNVLTYSYHGGENQKWKFSRTTVPKFSVSISNHKVPSSTAAYYKTSSISVSGDVTANYPVTKTELRIYNKSTGKVVKKYLIRPKNYRYSFSRKFSLSGLSAGKYYYKVYCWNIYNKTACTKSFPFTIKNRPGMKITLSNARVPDSSEAYMNTGHLLVDGTIKSTYAVKTMELRIYSRKTGVKDKIVLRSTSSPGHSQFSFSHEFDLSKLSAGKYFYRIHCKNSAGKWVYTKGYFFNVKKTSVSSPFASGGLYTFYSAVGSNKVMDVAGGGTAVNTNVLLYDHLDADNQKFKLLKYGKNGWYHIIDVNSGKALQVSGKTIQSNVCTGTLVKGSSRQLWRFLSAGNGYYRVQNKWGMYFLDVQGGWSDNLTNVQVWSAHFDKALKWKLRKTEKASKLSISNITEPGTLKKGDGFHLHGLVTSNYKITDLTVGIYRMNGTAFSAKNVQPNVKSYDISKHDYDISLPNETGTFRLCVIASDTHKKNVTLQDTQFAIVDNAVTYAAYTGVDYKSLTNNSRRLAALQKAQKMVTIRWTAPCNFVTWQSASGGYNPATAVDGSSDYKFVKGETYTGIPYSMAGRDWDDTTFANALKSNKITESYMKVPWSADGSYRSATTAHGVDCSKFVYYMVKAANTSVSVSSDLTTYTIPTCGAFRKLGSFSELRPGDVLNAKEHVRVFVGKNGDKYAVFEAAANFSRCVYKEYTASQLSGYTPYTFAGYND